MPVYINGRLDIGNCPQGNYDAVVAPTVNDDSNSGYSVGSMWVDTATGKVYVCTDATPGAAVWEEFNLGAVCPQGNYSAIVAPTVNDDSTLGYSVGSIWVDTVTQRVYACVDATVGAAVWQDLTATGTGIIISNIRYFALNGNDLTGNGTIEFPYQTPQKAIDDIELNLAPTASNPSAAVGLPGVHPSGAVIHKDGVHLLGTGGQQVTRLKPATGPALIVTNATQASLAAFLLAGGHADPNANYGLLAASADTPYSTQIRDIDFGDPSGGAQYDVMILGVGAGNSLHGSEFNMMRCCVWHDVFARSANYISLQGNTWIAGKVVARTCAGVWINDSQYNGYEGYYTVPGDDEPSDNGNYGLCGAKAVNTAGINLFGSARAGYYDVLSHIVKGNVTLVDTSAIDAESMHIEGNVSVEDDCSMRFKLPFILGNVTIQAGGAGTSRFDSGVYIGTLTDAGSKLVHFRPINFKATRGDILRRGASEWETYSPGAAGTVLTSGGPLADPTWQAPAGAGQYYYIVSSGAQLDAALVALRALGGGIVQLSGADFTYSPAANRDITNIKIIGSTNGISMTKLTFGNSNYLYGSCFELEQLGIDPYLSNAPFRILASTAFIRLRKLQHRGAPAENAFDFGGFTAYLWCEQVVSCNMNNTAAVTVYLNDGSSVTLRNGGAVYASSDSAPAGAPTSTTLQCVASRVSNDSSVPGANVKEALDNLRTSIGGFAVYMINKTGAPSVRGTLVEADPANDNAFIVAGIPPAASLTPIGIVYDAGIADGSLCRVVVAGIAECLLEDTTPSTRGNWVGSSGAQAGRVVMNIGVTPPSVAVHFQEVGHCIESKVAGAPGVAVLAKAIIHFN